MRVSYLSMSNMIILPNVRYIFISIIFFCLAGCNLDWEKPDISTPPPSEFRNSKPLSSKPIPAGPQFVVKFASSELNDLVTQVLSDNLQIAAAVARIKQADATARVDSAPLWPSLSAQNISGTYHYSAAENITTGMMDYYAKKNRYAPNWNTTFSGYYQGYFQTGINLSSYTIDFWGKNEDASYAARLQANATRFDRDVVEITQVTSLMSLYFQFLAYQDRLAISKRTVANFEKIYNAVKLRFEIGSASAFDLSQQGATLETQKAQIPQFEYYIEQTRNQIAVILGRTPESLELHGGSLKRLIFPKVEPGLPSEVLLRRPDVAEAEAKLASQEFSVLNARAQFFPSITISSFYGPNSILIWNLFRPDALASQLLGQLSQPIFDGYYLLGNYELQKSRYSELTALYRDTIISALKDVENALISIKKFKQALDVQVRAVAESQKAYDLQKLQFEQGTIDIVALTYTQSNLFNNQLQEVSLRLQYFLAASSLYQALGGGWSPTTRDAEIARANIAYQENIGPWP